ncbi:MAG: M56 family metallopeptidase [Balneola sp.]
MIVYFIKSTILLALLLGLYKLFLENEKMHSFNRFFLLVALGLGLTAPLIQIDISATTKLVGLELAKIESTINAPSEFVARTIEPVIAGSPSEPVSTPNETAGESTVPAFSKELFLTRKEMILGAYLLVTLFFLIRFGYGLFELFSNVRIGDKTSFKKATIILLEDAITPQSFFRWIFLNKKDFESGNIAPEILEHELTHIRQKHSLDVLLVEFLKTIFWFNPVLYFYKHSIQLNHEFLADEGAVTISDSITEYQSILLNFASNCDSEKITNRFDYGLTKKRLFMMQKTHSWFNKSVRALSIIPVITVFAILFCSSENSKELYIETANYGGVYTDQKLWFNFYEYPHTGGAIPKSNVYVDEQREPFTGVSNLYQKDSNILLSKSVYKNGYKTEWVNYHPNGQESYRQELEYQGKEWLSSTVFSEGTIKTEWLSPEVTSRKYGKMNEYHESGALKLELFFSWKDDIKHEIVYQDIMTLYDEQGNIIGQELYKDGELVEKIK